MCVYPLQSTVTMWCTAVNISIISIYLSIYISIYLSIYLGVVYSVPCTASRKCTDVHISIYLSIYISIYISIYLFRYCELCTVYCDLEVYCCSETMLVMIWRWSGLKGGSTLFLKGIFSENFFSVFGLFSNVDKINI